MTASRLRDHYAQQTARQELIDSLWRVQAIKVGVSPDAPRWVVETGIGIHHVVDVVRMLADCEHPFRRALADFVEAVSMIFNPPADVSTLPAGHGQRFHTNRTRSR